MALTDTVNLKLSFFLVKINVFLYLQDLYKTTLPFDPEGILGCLTSIVLVFFGVQVNIAFFY